MFPGDLTIDALSVAMQGGLARNRAIANNIANADTPGYRRLDVSFEGALAGAIADERAARSADGRSLPSLGAEPIDGAATMPRLEGMGGAGAMRVDGGEVDPDAEMAALATNQLTYQTVTGLLDKKFALIRTAITGQ